VSEGICPKCGEARQGGTYCLRCGIIFERYRPRDPRFAGGPGDEAPVDSPPANESLDEGSPPRSEAAIGVQPLLSSSFLSRLRRVYRVGRFLVVGVLGVVLILILWTASPPRVASDPGAPRRLEQKLERFQAESRLGLSPKLRLNESEVNSWMRTNLALAARSAPGPKASSGRSSSSVNLDSPTSLSAEEVQSNVRDVQVHMQGDRMTAYVLFDLYGKDLSLTLEGRLSVEGGCLRLSPTRMMLGSLPIPQATVERAVASLFDSPENRERLRLPPHIRDLRVENGELVVALR
jgi:hypothetical protein